METLDIIEIIQKHSLTVRCLPNEVVSYWTYREGDENKKYVDSNGNPIKSVKSVVIQDYDLKHFENTKPTKYDTDTPQQRYNTFKKNFPNGRKILKEVRQVENGGWWLVKQAKNTDSTIQFSFKHDFMAPTLQEAITLYLDSIK